MRPLLFVLLLLPALAGCLSGEDAIPNGTSEETHTRAEDAGRVTAATPSAPEDAYQVDAGEESGMTTVYPVPVPSTPVRDPVTVEYSGSFETHDCVHGYEWDPFKDGFHDRNLAEHLEPGDAFLYDLHLTFENTDSSWGDIHLWYLIGNDDGRTEGTVAEARGTITHHLSGQSYRVSDTDPAWVTVVCFDGVAATPVEYTLTVTLTFSERAIPASTPFLLEIPEDAARLFVRGVALDPAQGVQSHYRVFGPDDRLMCECALSSGREAASFDLSGPGDYVILVDHTANGFVTFALDVPHESEFKPLRSQFVARPVFATPGEAGVDATFALDLPLVPMDIWAWIHPEDASGDVGVSRNMKVSITNRVGDVFSAAVPGSYHMNYPVTGWPYTLWVWPPLMEVQEDHHALAAGEHQVTVTADYMRGELRVSTLEYVRP